MNPKTTEFVRKLFRHYYQTEYTSAMPQNLIQREWGFVPFGNPQDTHMLRHISFTLPGEVQQFLITEAPAHVYYSTALYQNPKAEMADKEWLGAELIFDLDADHNEADNEIQSMSYEKQLEIVNFETCKLISVLTQEFGIPESEISINFSGARGYHVHVINNELHTCDRQARREIVDYIKCTGFNAAYFLEPTDRKECIIIKNGRGKQIHTILTRFMHDIAMLEDREAINAIRKIKGLEDRKKAKILLAMSRDETVISKIETGLIPHTSKPIREALLNIISQFIQASSLSLIDEPVTSDIKRLIRLPGSLHGKSALIASPLTIDDLAWFDPLINAVPFSNKPIAITGNKEYSITLKDTKYWIAPNERIEMPEYAAIHYLAQDAAEIA